MKPKLLMLITIGLLMVAAVIWVFTSADQKSQLKSEVLLPETSKAAPLSLDVEAESSVNTKATSPKAKKIASKPLLTELHYNAEDLQVIWNTELGCFNLPEDDEMWCEYPELSAASYAEALWMLENGYPPASVLREMESLSDEQLKIIAKDPQDWLAQLILAQRYAENGNSYEAHKRFSISEYRRINSYGLMRRGMSLIHNADPNAPGWAYRTAAVQFRKAHLLGDYVGDQLFHELINSYWNGTPGFAETTDIVETAIWELSNYFDLPRRRWPVQQRPAGG